MRILRTPYSLVRLGTLAMVPLLFFSAPLAQDPPLIEDLLTFSDPLIQDGGVSFEVRSNSGVPITAIYFELEIDLSDGRTLDLQVGEDYFETCGESQETLVGPQGHISGPFRVNDSRHFEVPILPSAMTELSIQEVRQIPVTVIFETGEYAGNQSVAEDCFRTREERVQSYERWRLELAVVAAQPKPMEALRLLFTRLGAEVGQFADSQEEIVKHFLKQNVAIVLAQSRGPFESELGLSNILQFLDQRLRNAKRHLPAEANRR